MNTNIILLTSNIIQIVEDIRKKYLLYDYFWTILISVLTSLIAIFLFYLFLSKIFEKKFSFEVKKSLFIFLKRLPELESIEIKNYLPRGDKSFYQACQILFPSFSVYKKEDTFDIFLKDKGTELRFAEVEVGYYEKYGKRSKYIKLFRGIIFRIPINKIAKSIPHNSCKIDNYTYVAVSHENKDLLEFSLFKPINTEIISNFFSELRMIIKDIENFIN